MSRLYDQLMSRGFGYNERAKDQLTLLPEILERAVVIDINNVAQYFKMQSKSGHEWSWANGDFPNCAPPWQTFFMELAAGNSGIRDGILFDSVDVGRDIPVYGPEGIIDDARWLISAWPFIRLSGQDPRERYVPVRLLFAVGAEGQRLAIASPNSAFAWESFEWNRDDEAENKNFMISALNYAKWLVFPSLLAISFLHCKNVKVTEFNPSPKLDKTYQRRHNRPMVRYKTLEITPMKEILRKEGKSETLGLQKALHICRGHFKDYAEKPLFGKHQGLYWWDAHVRGTAERGAVIKDYSVNKPTEGR